MFVHPMPRRKNEKRAEKLIFQKRKSFFASRFGFFQKF